MNKPMMEAALGCVRRGHRIVPLHGVTAGGKCSCGKSPCGKDNRSAGKHPIPNDWPKIATTDETIIRGWFRQWPTMNFGIATGAESGVWVLDVEAEGLATLAELEATHGPLPKTYTTQTGGKGKHYFFAWPAGITIPSRGVPGVHKIDSKGAGGQVVAPPSKSGKGDYTVLIDAPIVPAPEWLIKIVMGETEKPKTKPASNGPADVPFSVRVHRARQYLATVEPGVDGERGSNPTLWAARVLVRGFILDRATARKMMDEYSERCVPPWSDKEIEHKLTEAETKPFDLPVGWLLHTEKANANGTPTANGKPADSPKTPAEWPDPIPLRSDPVVPEFPVDVLPRWLKDWTVAQAVELQVPVDLPAISALVIVSAGIGRKVTVEAWDGWIEPTNLFGFIALLTGERKSQLFRKAMLPVNGLERWLQESAKPRIAEAESRHRVASKRIEHLEGKLAKAEPNERSQIEDDLRAAVRELETIVVPVLPVLHVGDETPESLSRELVRQSGRLLAASAEAAALGNLVRDKKAILDCFLSGYTGEELRTGRIGRGREGIDRPALSCLYAPQPTVLEGLAQTQEMRGRGFFARWLFSLPKSRVGYRDVQTAPVPDAIRSQYADFISQLWLIDYEDEKLQTPYKLTLTDEARAKFSAFLRWLEPQLRQEESLGQMSGWANKLGGLILRLAAALHAAGGIECGVGWLRDPISAHTVEQAIRIGRDYCIDHARAAFDAMGVSEVVVNARKVLKWIKDGAKDGTFTKSEAHRGTRPAFETVDDIEPTLELLVRHHIIRHAAPDAKEGAGRKKSPGYEVNPAAFREEGQGLGSNGKNGRNAASAPAEGDSRHSRHSCPSHMPPITNPEPPAPEPEPVPESASASKPPKKFGNNPNRPVGPKGGAR